MKKLIIIIALVLICLLPCMVTAQTKVNVHTQITTDLKEDSSGSTTWRLGPQADVDTSVIFSIAGYPWIATLIHFQALGTAHANSLAVSAYLDVNWTGTEAGTWVQVDSMANLSQTLAAAASSDTAYYRRWGIGKTMNGTSATVAEGITPIIAPYARIRLQSWAILTAAGENITIKLIRSQ